MAFPPHGALSATLLIAAAMSLPLARTPAHAETVLLHDAVASLSTDTESRAGYRRSSFRHWVDADRDSCNTRGEVLIDEATSPPQISTKCALTGGRWHSYYDDVTVEQASELDVDHVVPLAEAWDSGASTWTATQRQAYANDLIHPDHLVAVTARSNRQKADQDPSQWLPIEPVRCRYIAEWTAIKTRWELTVDAAEKDTLTSIAATCPNVPLEIAPLP
ncbi:HNH endonuclease family protein [Nonomuraea sp. LPB2021202275-12-8]|uniref:HNH endonuclease family protein n=1 Tax=Nonomuraea sp. LPB2021202275-12-8 TaxID=3120159 RepID=UPI00300D081A